MTDLTVERLRELLDYDPDTGLFTWRVRTSKCVTVGAIAGCLDKGYLRIQIDRRLHLAHRLAWLYITGDWPPAQIDHINGIRDDNRIANLRAATRAENMHNRRKPHSNTTSGYLGVSRYRGKFMAQIKLDGKSKFLGLFDTPEEAHAVYLEAKRRLHPYGTI